MKKDDITAEEMNNWNNVNIYEQERKNRILDYLKHDVLSLIEIILKYDLKL